MKTSEQLAKPGVSSPPAANRGPEAFTPAPHDVPSGLPEAALEPPPPTARRTIKGKLYRRGRSQPIAVVNPWE